LVDQLAYDVVVPAFNAGETISECLRSIMGQSVKPARVIVVDDGSVDDTAAKVQAFGQNVELIRQQNLGPGSATSTGIISCTQPIIATLDADDLWLESKMALQLSYLAKNPQFDGIFGMLQSFRSNGVLGAIENGWCRSTMVVRHKVFETTGAIIDPPGRHGEMIDWIARARESGCQFHMLEMLVANRRIHAGSLTFKRSFEGDAGYLHIARQAILRRREKAGTLSKDLA
jgi:glycosyltransferase involved in cell wall biosynthesis